MRRTPIVRIPFETLGTENMPCASLRALPLTPSTVTSASGSGSPAGDCTCPLSGGCLTAGCFAPPHGHTEDADRPSHHPDHRCLRAMLHFNKARAQDWVHKGLSRSDGGKDDGRG